MPYRARRRRPGCSSCSFGARSRATARVNERHNPTHAGESQAGGELTPRQRCGWTRGLAREERRPRRTSSWGHGGIHRSRVRARWACWTLTFFVLTAQLRSKRVLTMQDERAGCQAVSGCIAAGITSGSTSKMRHGRLLLRPAGPRTNDVRFCRRYRRTHLRFSVGPERQLSDSRRSISRRASRSRSGCTSTCSTTARDAISRSYRTSTRRIAPCYSATRHASRHVCWKAGSPWSSVTCTTTSHSIRRLSVRSACT